MSKITIFFIIHKKLPDFNKNKFVKIKEKGTILVKVKKIIDNEINKRFSFVKKLCLETYIRNKYKDIMAICK